MDSVVPTPSTAKPTFQWQLNDRVWVRDLDDIISYITHAFIIGGCIYDVTIDSLFCYEEVLHNYLKLLFGQFDSSWLITRSYRYTRVHHP